MSRYCFFLLIAVVLVAMSVTGASCAAQVCSFEYAGNEQTFITPCDGVYKIELWGASTEGMKKGAYVCGLINLIEGETLYIYVGEKGGDGNKTVFNGGGQAGCTGREIPIPQNIWQGSGATDARLLSGDWNEKKSLQSRFIVAAGAGGCNSFGSDIHGSGGQAGGLTGYDGKDSVYGNFCTFGGKGASQVSGGMASDFNKRAINDHGITAGETGSLGVGGQGGEGRDHPDYYYGGYGGGGGYYGGGGSSGGGYMSSGFTAGGGGSSYISGHAGCIAPVPEIEFKSEDFHELTSISKSIHPSGKFFTSTVMIDGAGYEWTDKRGEQVPMPKPTEGNYTLGFGHNGNGYARISLLNRTFDVPVIVRRADEDYIAY